MTDSKPTMVVGEGGLSGAIEARLEAGPDGQPGYLIRLDSGHQVAIPEGLMTLTEDGTYRIPMSRSQLEAYEIPEGAFTIVLPVVAEGLRVEKRRFESGRVRVSTRVLEHEEVVEEPGFREVLEIERVPLGRVLTEPVSIRQEGDTTIVPLVEEVLVTEKRLVLREEIRITKRREEVKEPQRVTLRRQEATIERVEPDQAEV